MTIASRIAQQPSRRVLLLCAWVVLGIGLVDWATGTEVQLSFFYLIPIMSAGWFGGRRVGAVIACLSAATWVVAEWLWGVHYSQQWILFWNGLVRLGSFLVASELTSRMALQKRNEQVLLQTQNQALQKEIAERKEADARLQELNQTLEKQVQERTAAAEARALALAQSRDALRHQTDILQAILNSMGDGVVVVDSRRNVLLLNAEAERLMPTEVRGETIERILNQSLGTGLQKKEIIESFPKRSGLGPEVFVSHSTAPNGLWLHVISRPLRGDNSESQGAVVVLSDVTPQKLMEKQIAESVEREQSRIGQDIHDGLCQQLVSIAFALATLRDHFAEKNLTEAKHIDGLSDILNDCITEARKIARGLYPVQIERNGLSAALEQLSDDVQSLNGIRCQCVCDVTLDVPDLVVASNLFRIAQEAVNNAIKHSQAGAISIRLERLPNGELSLVVADDGSGLPKAKQVNGGMGLHTMNYRARMIGASLDIQPRHPSGTVVACSLQHSGNKLSP